MTYLVNNLPEYLRVVVGRRVDDGERTGRVEFPLILETRRVFKMSPDNAALLDQNYELVSVIVSTFLKQSDSKDHKGPNFNSGHYYAFVKRVRDGVEQWIKCNDNNLQSVDANEIKASNSYILMYKLLPTKV